MIDTRHTSSANRCYSFSWLEPMPSLIFDKFFGSWILLTPIHKIISPLTRRLYLNLWLPFYHHFLKILKSILISLTYIPKLSNKGRTIISLQPSLSPQSMMQNSDVWISYKRFGIVFYHLPIHILQNLVGMIASYHTHHNINFWICKSLHQILSSMLRRIWNISIGAESIFHKFYLKPKLLGIFDSLLQSLRKILGWSSWWRNNPQCDFWHCGDIKDKNYYFSL